MWKAIDVYGMRFLWCVRDGALQVYDEEDYINPPEKRFYSVYNYNKKCDAFSRTRVQDDITQQQVLALLKKAVHTDIDYAIL